MEWHGGYNNYGSKQLFVFLSLCFRDLSCYLITIDSNATLNALNDVSIISDTVNDFLFEVQPGLTSMKHKTYDYVCATVPAASLPIGTSAFQDASIAGGMTWGACKTQVVDGEARVHLDSLQYVDNMND